MQPQTRRLFVLILLAQLGCAAAGLGFNYLYTGSALTQAEEAEVRTELEHQFGLLAKEVGGADLALLADNSAAWKNLIERFRSVRGDSDRLFLLDRHGRLVADDAGVIVPTPEVQTPVTLAHATAEWGTFAAPIQGVFELQPGQKQIGLAQGLGGRDGYVLLTRETAARPISAALVKHAIRVGIGVTFLWIAILQAATLFMIVTHCKLSTSRGQGQANVDALKQAQALVRTQETVIFGLAKLADSRDPDTGSHLERIAHYCSALATAMRQQPEFHDEITPSFVQLIGISSALHDIGKVGVEDSILLKPGSLTREERTRMQRHPQIAEECLKEIERRLGSSNFLQMAREISSAHHERWDGFGYPLGLSGEQIPLSARIVAVADVYDALSRKRIYKEALPHEMCVKAIFEAAGSHFDPRVVEAFMQIKDRFHQISQQFLAPRKSTDAEASMAIPPSDPPDFVASSGKLVASVPLHAIETTLGETNY
ncbi:MAG TPA: HD domain-containing phosphohydrolase [Pirellulales bacterium]|nr:HD domain-containing phosphohydrolase [Pirellulales bacterium]